MVEELEVSLREAAEVAGPQRGLGDLDEEAAWNSIL